MKRKKQVAQKVPEKIISPPELKKCENCGHEDSGNYCSNCGQSFVNLNRPMKEILHDFLGILSIDKSIVSTFVPFLFKPGFLTSEYLAGRRKRYMSPVKLYIFLSLVFFFVARMGANRSAGEMDNLNFTVGSDSTQTVLTSKSALKEALINDSIYYEGEIPTDSMGIVTDEGSEKLRKSLLNAAENPDSYVAGYLKNLSYALFLIMPMFALILQLLYIRRKRFYVEHLLFSINMHSFALLVLSIVFFVKMLLTNNDDYADLLTLVIPVYFTIGMKRFYKQSLAKIILKEIILTILYTILLIIVLGGLAFLTIYLI